MDILSARKKAAERAKAGKTEKPAPERIEKPAPEPSAARVDSAPAPSPDELQPITEVMPEEIQTQQKDGRQVPSDAQTPDAGQTAEEIEMLAFRLGDEEYAVLIEDVKEVLQIRDLTPVPNAPSYILGVTSLRGLILPVIDLCRRLGLPEAGRDGKSRIVVVSAGDEQSGIIVDRVTGVVRINAEMMRAVPETIEHGADFLRGIARKEDRLFILLDIEKAVGNA